MRIGLYLVVGLLLAGLLGALLLAGGVAWQEAALMALPLGMMFAAICVAARYPCKAAPLATTGPLRLAGTHATGAVASVGAWIFLGMAMAHALEDVGGMQGTVDRFKAAAPTLVIVAFVVFLLAVAMQYLVLALETARAEQVRLIEARVLAREAELRALRAQIDPHFLFNSLNSIGTLTGDDPAAARRMCLLLAGFLRRSLVLGARDRIPLSEELALSGDYLAIEKVRFGARLTVAQEIADAVGGLLVPPLLLQPLIENAVRHGVAQLGEGGILNIAARRAEGQLRIEVTNPRDPHRSGRGGAGLGLENVRGRLRTLFGDQARMEVVKDDHSFRVTLTLPAVQAPPVP
ncbi:MAG TPA: histidine kinase, partial [Candidatus Polarisedimenticolia bacterium]|nr:histidine kinase [Candidatus Polarisedimenticolia bacterium]